MEASVLVAGAPRSGTTWVAEVLERALHGRLMFEPFQPHLVPEFAGLAPFLYIRTEEANERLRSGWSRVLDGSLRNGWVDKNLTTARPHCRIVKTIRSNLMLGWLGRTFPSVPLLFIMRHPCAVVLSRMHYGWSAEDDLAAMLGQQKLLDDHLGPYLDRIHAARTPEERHAILWCISALVPLRQIGCADLRPLFYEHLYADQDSLAGVLGTSIGREIAPLPTGVSRQPSRTTTTSSPIRRDGDNLAHWQSVLPADSIRRILDLVAVFGLDDLYGADPLPRRGPAHRPPGAVAAP